MADDQQSLGEKTEPATPRKRQDAREKGQVSRSTDLNTAVLLLSAFLLVFFLAGRMVSGVASLQILLLDGLASSRLSLESVIAMGSRGLINLVGLMLPFLLITFLVALALNILQVGFLITSHPITPDLQRINPLKGFKRIFSRRGLMRLIFGLFKLGVVGAVIVYSLRTVVSPESSQNLLTFLSLDVFGAIHHANYLLFAIGVRAAAALLILAILDFAFQRWQHSQDLKMTKQEVREELKRMEGDPKVKERRRKIQQRLALQRMMFEVPKADVVITNPTHVACGIRYDESEMTAPELLAKGEGHVAHRIREIAVTHGVPVVERPALARLIYETAEVGEEIPPDLYQPVAEVLAYVYRLSHPAQPAAAVGEPALGM